MQASKNKFASGRKGKKAAGFSLIELLIVVAVILIIAGTAIPNFIRSKMRANEAGAVANMRNVCTANVVYNTTYGMGFALGLANLGGNPATPDPTAAGLIDSVLSSGVKSGYIYTYTVLASDAFGNAVAYSLNADPITPGTSGDRHFYTDQSALIRQSLTGPAGPSDTPLN
jgi:prepilin-type N-terminal cleavage/methylation domain-containing protein